MTASHYYMAYQLDPSGAITRTHRRITVSDKDAANYATCEKLSGWPEPCVYWQMMRDGSGIGISPMSDAARAALAKATA